ncbi:DNA-3-methyladenine glycosylase I [Shimia biformata]|uniref:DNA-3-methyladenine glycosylase I n=1 Tax=Shimia biformata TaxID=1294299 RepID=UPI001951EC20|nr:DNA-3-methyladenine glycosylase I [Shimia biformata]
MRTFDEIFTIAADRKGGIEALEGMLSRPMSPEKVAAQPDDRWLSAMAKSIFQAGFNWKVIDAKWDGFETAFHGFDPVRVAHYHDEDMDRLISDKGIVRNGPKIAAVMDNARYVVDLAAEHGGMGRFVADWPGTEFIGLLDHLKKNGARLGGNTGQRMLRVMGKDGFMLSRDVTARLIAEGVVDKVPSSKRDMAAVQDAFNIWAEQSGRSLTEISRVLAFSVGS